MNPADTSAVERELEAAMTYARELSSRLQENGQAPECWLPLNRCRSALVRAHDAMRTHRLRLAECTIIPDAELAEELIGLRDEEAARRN